MKTFLSFSPCRPSYTTDWTLGRDHIWPPTWLLCLRPHRPEGFMATQLCLAARWLDLWPLEHLSLLHLELFSARDCGLKTLPAPYSLSGRQFRSNICDCFHGFCCVWSAEKEEEFILGEEMVIGPTDTTAVGPSLYFLPHPTWWRKDGNCTWLVLSSVFSLLTFFIQSVSPHPSPTFSFQHDQVQSALSSFASPSFTDSRAASNRAAHTKEDKKSVINDALFPLWKKRVWRASFVISVLLEPQTQQGFSSKRNYYYAVGTVLYNNLSFWNNFLTDHQSLSYRDVFGEKIMHLGKKIESIMIEIVYMLLLFCIY